MRSVGKLLRDPVLIIVVAAAALYAAVANPYYLFLLTVGALTVIVGVGLNVLIGLTGQVSFGHVGFYALGLRLLVRAGRPPVVAPAEFTDAITVISEKEARRAEKAAAKAAKRNPLTEGQKRLALIGAYACFAVCAAAVLGGLLLIVFNH